VAAAATAATVVAAAAAAAAGWAGSAAEAGCEGGRHIISCVPQPHTTNHTTRSVSLSLSLSISLSLSLSLCLSVSRSVANSLALALALSQTLSLRVSLFLSLSEPSTSAVEDWVVAAAGGWAAVVAEAAEAEPPRSLSSCRTAPSPAAPESQTQQWCTAWRHRAPAAAATSRPGPCSRTWCRSLPRPTPPPDGCLRQGRPGRSFRQKRAR
jgi:hypothetical protein